MNYDTLNSASLNSAAIRVIVGAVAATLISVSGSAIAQRLAQPFVVQSLAALSGSTSIDAIRYAQATSSSLSIYGEARGERRHNGGASATITTSGNSPDYLVYRGAKADIYQGFTGAVAPHYFVVPPPINSGAIPVSGHSVIGYPTTRAYPAPGIIRLDGYAFSPTLKTFKAFEGVISFDGFAIPANHLGYAVTGGITVSGLANGLRLANARAVIAASVQSDISVSNYNTAEGFSFGTVTVIGTTNVKLNNTQLVEQQFGLSLLSGAVEPQIRRQELTPVDGAIFNTVEVSANENIRRTAYADDYLIEVTGPNIDTERKATPKRTVGQIRLSGLAFADIRNPAPTSGTLSVFTNTSLNAASLRYAASLGSVGLSGVIADSVIRDGTALVGAASCTNSPITTVLFSTPLPVQGGVVISGGSAWAMYTASGRATANQVSYIVTARGDVMFTATTNNTEVSGFAYGVRVKQSGASSGAIAFGGEVDAIANPYVKASEDRSMIIPSFGSKEYLHIAAVPYENRSMTA